MVLTFWCRAGVGAAGDGLGGEGSFNLAPSDLVIEDIVVAMRNYEKFARFITQLKKRSRLPIPTFGHLADGNLHVNIMYHRDNASEAKRA